MRLIVDPPMLESPCCGAAEFTVATRASGVVHERHDLRTGAMADNTHLWEDMVYGRTSRIAKCGDCGATIGRVVGEAPDVADHGPSRALIRIVTLAVLDAESRILLVGKRGLEALILPGGKREPGEGDLEALCREIREELGCGILGRPRFVGVFRDAAGGAPDVDVEVTMYAGRLSRDPTPLAEIERLEWCDPEAPGHPVAPSLENLILPYLAASRTATA